MKNKIKIILADDHILVRNGIKAMLEQVDDIEVVGEANDGQQALEQIQNLQPEIAIVDIRMPAPTGLEIAAKLNQNHISTKTIILSMHDSDDYVIQAVKSGAYGYLLKDIDKNEFIKAIRQVQLGHKYFSGSVSAILAEQLLSQPSEKPESKEYQNKYDLTRREKEILKLVVDGKQNKTIAESLGKSVRTIETHRFNIMKKMKVNNAIDMVNKAIKERLLE